MAAASQVQEEELPYDQQLRQVVAESLPAASLVPLAEDEVLVCLGPLLRWPLPKVAEALVSTAKHCLQRWPAG